MSPTDMKILMAIYDRQYEIVADLIMLYGESSNSDIKKLSQEGIEFLCDFVDIFNAEKEA